MPSPNPIPPMGTPQIAAQLPILVQTVQCPHCSHFLTQKFNYTANRTEFFHVARKDSAAHTSDLACPNYGHSWYINAGTVTLIA